jgi:methionyl-tRNA formyltransferase
MTRRGLETVKAIVGSYPGLVGAVIGARDNAIAEDSYEEIRGFCAANAVKFQDSSSPVAETEYSIAVGWRWLIRQGGSRLIVLHDSLLPRYRGFNPLVTALINGDEEIGVTALFATDEYDSGDIITQSASRIRYPITIREAIETVLHNYRTVALDLAGRLMRGEALRASPQDEASASFSLWRDEQDYFIDWSLPADTIRRAVDALGFPYKGAAAVVEGRILRVRRAHALPDVSIANRTAGKVIFVRDAKPIVVCGSGLLRIDDLVDDATGASALPLVRFRTRFTAPDRGFPFTSRT